jgi:hypothetical protein
MLTRGSLSWLIEHPDNDDLNAALIDAYGEIVPLPIPYAAVAPYETVAAAMAVLFPNHDVMRGNDIEFPVQYLTVLDDDGRAAPDGWESITC